VAARRAIECDDNEAWGHWAMAACYMLRRDRDPAEREYALALELNPNDADVLAWYALFSCYVGRPLEGIGR
jgi:Tfp pilus assembly protein PilF